MAGERLAQMFKNAKGNEQDFTDILFGVVTKVKPLTINVENRFEIEESFLVLSKTVQNYNVSIDVPTVTSTSADIVQPPVTNNKVDVDKNVTSRNVVTGVTIGSKKVEIPIFKSLQVGDKVSMIRAQKGQLYYVLDRR